MTQRVCEQRNCETKPWLAAHPQLLLQRRTHARSETLVELSTLPLTRCIICTAFAKRSANRLKRSDEAPPRYAAAARNHLALSLQTQAPPRVVVDLGRRPRTRCPSSPRSTSALQSLRPEGPWRDQRDLPQHRWRTFDLARKYHRVLRELRVVRPADACMMLRLLFEEDEVGRRAIAARKDPSGTKWEGGGWAPTEGKLQGVRPGTRPLTAGEVVENWDEVLGPRCFARWRSEDADFPTGGY